MIKYMNLYLRVPSNLVAIVSKKVFCGANKPFFMFVTLET